MMQIKVWPTPGDLVRTTSNNPNKGYKQGKVYVVSDVNDKGSVKVVGSDRVIISTDDYELVNIDLGFENQGFTVTNKMLWPQYKRLVAELQELATIVQNEGFNPDAEQLEAWNDAFREFEGKLMDLKITTLESLGNRLS